MFQNYSQTYSANIVALAGFAVIFARAFGLEVAESDLIFLFGLLANLGGVVWALYHRFSKGDITPVGARK